MNAEEHKKFRAAEDAREFERDKERRAEALQKMKAASDTFYGLAVRTGCHAFIEFAGLMNEFITLCHKAEDDGVNWLIANTHTNTPIPIREHNIDYLAEKLDCIYGPSLEAAGLRDYFARRFVGTHQGGSP